MSDFAQPDPATVEIVEGIGNLLLDENGLMVIPVEFDGEDAWALATQDDEGLLLLAIVANESLLKRMTVRPGFQVNIRHAGVLQ